jgi:hypothetical protein
MSVREGKTSHINEICSQKVRYALKKWDIGYLFLYIPSCSLPYICFRVADHAIN